jgi:hypothetical protein
MHTLAAELVHSESKFFFVACVHVVTSLLFLGSQTSWNFLHKQTLQGIRFLTIRRSTSSGVWTTCLVSRWLGCRLVVLFL